MPGEKRVPVCRVGSGEAGWGRDLNPGDGRQGEVGGGRHEFVHGEELAGRDVKVRGGSWFEVKYYPYYYYYDYYYYYHYYYFHYY
nr:hypothetical protein BaRGS_026981 [Batillaria attramentaria]